MLPSRAMELIPRKLPERPLLSAIEADPPPVQPADANADSPFALKGSRLFSGNGRAICLGICAGAVLISVLGVTYERHQHAKREAMNVPRMFTVATGKAVTTPPGTSTPAPLVVEMNPELIHVTAIALGHPRLAVINGRSVAEGDWINVHGPSRNITVALRVLKIADGRIDLTDGTQVISAHLEIAKPVGRDPK